MAREIMKNDDGSVNKEWWELHGIREAFPEIPENHIGSY
jgi:hypothetical protein